MYAPQCLICKYAEVEPVVMFVPTQSHVKMFPGYIGPTCKNVEGLQ